MIRRITAADAPALRSFECAGYREPWADTIEETVRALPGALGAVQALGLFAGTKLVGVAAWSVPHPESDASSGGETAVPAQGPRAGALATCHVLAVALGHRGRGHARALKEAVMEECRKEGCVAVASVVAYENDHMLELNLHLGAAIDQLDPWYFRCVIAL